MPPSRSVSPRCTPLRRVSSTESTHDSATLSPENVHKCAQKYMGGSALFILSATIRGSSDFDKDELDSPPQAHSVSNGAVTQAYPSPLSRYIAERSTKRRKLDHNKSTELEPPLEPESNPGDSGDSLRIPEPPASQAEKDDSDSDIEITGESTNANNVYILSKPPRSFEHSRDIPASPLSYRGGSAKDTHIAIAEPNWPQRRDRSSSVRPPAKDDEDSSSVELQSESDDSSSAHSSYEPDMGRSVSEESSRSPSPCFRSRLSHRLRHAARSPSSEKVMSLRTREVLSQSVDDDNDFGSDSPERPAKARGSPRLRRPSKTPSRDLHSASEVSRFRANSLGPDATSQRGTTSASSSATCSGSHSNKSSAYRRVRNGAPAHWWPVPPPQNIDEMVRGAPKSSVRDGFKSSQPSAISDPSHKPVPSKTSSYPNSVTAPDSHLSREKQLKSGRSSSSNRVPSSSNNASINGESAPRTSVGAQNAAGNLQSTTPKVTPSGPVAKDKTSTSSHGKSPPRYREKAAAPGKEAHVAQSSPGPRSLPREAMISFNKGSSRKLGIHERLHGENVSQKTINQSSVNSQVSNSAVHVRPNTSDKISRQRGSDSAQERASDSAVTKVNGLPASALPESAGSRHERRPPREGLEDTTSKTNESSASTVSGKALGRVNGRSAKASSEGAVANVDDYSSVDKARSIRRQSKQRSTGTAKRQESPEFRPHDRCLKSIQSSEHETRRYGTRLSQRSSQEPRSQTPSRFTPSRMSPASNDATSIDLRSPESSQTPATRSRTKTCQAKVVIDSDKVIPPISFYRDKKVVVNLVSVKTRRMKNLQKVKMRWLKYKKRRAHSQNLNDKLVPLSKAFKDLGGTGDAENSSDDSSVSEFENQFSVNDGNSSAAPSDDDDTADELMNQAKQSMGDIENLMYDSWLNQDSGTPTFGAEDSCYDIGSPLFTDGVNMANAATFVKAHDLSMDNSVLPLQRNKYGGQGKGKSVMICDPRRPPASKKKHPPKKKSGSQPRNSKAGKSGGARSNLRRSSQTAESQEQLPPAEPPLQHNDDDLNFIAEFNKIAGGSEGHDPDAIDPLVQLYLDSLNGSHEAKSANKQRQDATSDGGKESGIHHRSNSEGVGLGSSDLLRREQTEEDSLKAVGGVDFRMLDELEATFQSLNDQIENSQMCNDAFQLDFNAFDSFDMTSLEFPAAPDGNGTHNDWAEGWQKDAHGEAYDSRTRLSEADSFGAHNDSPLLEDGQNAAPMEARSTNFPTEPTGELLGASGQRNVTLSTPFQNGTLSEEPSEESCVRNDAGFSQIVNGHHEDDANDPRDELFAVTQDSIDAENGAEGLSADDSEMRKVLDCYVWDIKGEIDKIADESVVTSQIKAAST